MSGPLLLPIPFAANSVSLGQLLCDPLDPSTHSTPSVPTPNEQPQRQANYKEIIAIDDQGRFVSTLASRSPSPLESLLAVTADHVEHITLPCPSTHFDSIRQDASAAGFLRRMALQKQPLYYVVGLQRLRNSTFRRAAANEGRITSATPVDPKIRLPLHLRRDSAMDLDEASNDIITGISMRKVKCNIGPPEEPHSLDDVDYVWSYESLEDDLQLSIGLGKALEQAELHALADIIPGEDFSDASYDGYYDISDDEGLGGF
ncbi:hypothetical protein BDV96DRAFT_641861 [Lophiotrema nucula]|uniref:Uncharacterized protein n=1 Tax=Lophiotrema nucula TaxID=690887 RepID=A0A6A5ZMD6_9PLEO|nr:hypothetical protein BDV96DRAFT_641861 [Lophiotrema nucula]